MNTQIVLYRSRFEAETDAFFYDHPEYAIGLVIGLVILIVIIFVAHLLLSWYQKRNFNRKWNRHEKGFLKKLFNR